jgi:hypothetical protein
MGECVSERVGESVSNWSLQPSYTSSSNSTRRSGDADYKCETTYICQSWESGVRALTTSDRNTSIVSRLASTCRFNNTSAETTCTPFLESKRVILKQILYSISRFPLYNMVQLWQWLSPLSHLDRNLQLQLSGLSNTKCRIVEVKLLYDGQSKCFRKCSITL